MLDMEFMRIIKNVLLNYIIECDRKTGLRMFSNPSFWTTH